MTKVKIIGGLGNQLFQYFFARSLKLKFNINVKLDLSDFEIYKLHQYNLNNFLKLKLPISEKKYSFINFFLNKKKENDPFKFDDTIFKKKFSYYDGYWQSYRYFNKFWCLFKNDFKFDNKYTNIQILNKIKNSNSVAVHVRRGDYVDNNRTSKFHGNLNIKYYNRSIKFFENKYKNIKFFFFSDDIEWVKKQFNNKKYHFIENDKKKIKMPISDLILMKNCKHNIIANSTFSWWGAWLNDNKSKTVCVPKYWTAKRKITDTDLIPNNWKII